MQILRVLPAIWLLSALSGCSSEAEPDPSHGSGSRGGTMRADAGQHLDASRSSACSAPADASACANGRPILDGAVVNARDLGGTSLEDGARVAYGALFRGPPLAALSPAGCAAFAELGIRTVVDLRVASERERKPNDSCVSERANIITAPLPIPYSVSGEDYIADLDTTDSIAKAFRALGDEAAYPLYFHCTWGRDRTGVVAAVILLSLGATHADILAEYELSEATVGAFPNSLTALLAEIDRRGGIDAYFEAAGIPADAIATLRARASTR